MKKILVIGGYGFFGNLITRRLAADPAIRVIIAGRDAEKCRALAAELQKSPNLPLYHALDLSRDLPAVLEQVKPDIVINAAGPFQGQDYKTPEACIGFGCHYIDLADARDYVAGIGALDKAAKATGRLVITGASSVPCLTAALIDHYLPKFARLASVDYGITVAQKTRMGASTAAAVLSYAGKAFTRLRNGKMETVYGGLGLHMQNYPELGLRLFGDCDIPDLALFPARYPSLENIRFSAGQENALLQLGIWKLSWMVRAGFPRSLDRHAKTLMKLRGMFDIFGGDESGLHMTLGGTGHNGQPRETKFYMIAKSGHGPHIPATPAVLLAQGLVHNTITKRGAMPCLGLIGLQHYIAGLKGLDIRTMETTTPA